MGKTRARSATSTVTLDAGALIALDKGSPKMIALLQLAVRKNAKFHVPAAVVGQAWRDGSRQVSVARFLRTPEVAVHSLDGEAAKACGELCGAAGTRDVIDASVVLLARETKSLVLTSDPDDLLRLDPNLEWERV